MSTRQIRKDEIDGYDYNFVTDEEYNKKKFRMFQSVEHQFLPFRYGSTFEDMVYKKWNLIVVSIEGFLSGANKIKGLKDEILVNIINDDVLDIQREGRDPLQEERINKAILRPFAEDSNWRYIKIGSDICIPYFEIPLSKLKTLRDDKTKLLEYFEEIINKAAE